MALNRLSHLLFENRIFRTQFLKGNLLKTSIAYASLIFVSLIVAIPVASAAAVPTQQQLDAASREADRIQREQIERLEQERREELLKRPHTSIEVEVPSGIDRAGDLTCRDVKEVVIEGAKLMPEAMRQKLAKPYIGKCMTAHDIELLLGSITQYYMDKGYIAARAYIQMQDLATGILRILVVEGVVEKLMLDGEKTNSSVFLPSAFPFLEGKPLNLRDIEQGLDQVNRLTSNNATMEIKPGEKAGGTIVLIHNQPSRRLRTNLTYDNFGGTATGEEQLGLNVSLDNPMGLNDALSVTHRRSTDADFNGIHSRSNSFLYSVPVGYLTFNASHTWSDYATTIHPPGGDLVSNGYSKNTSLSSEYVAYRDKSSRLAITGTLTAKSSENYLAGQLLGVSSRTLSTFDLGTSWNTRLLDGVLGLNLNHVWGLRMFNALQDPSDLPDFAPHAQFRKWTAGASWMKPFQIGKQNFTFSTAINGQVGVDVLYGSEQFSIGSLYSVRGYRNTSIAGDTGYYWRNDLAAPFQVQAGSMPMNIKPYIAYDFGYIKDRNAEIGGHLTGMIVGVTASIAKVSADISCVKPLTMPDALKDEGLQLFAKLAVNF